MVYVSVTYNQSMSPSDLHLLIHFRQRWAKHDPCLLSVFRLLFFQLGKICSVIQERPKDTVSNTHPTCLVTALEEEVAFDPIPVFWCLPSAWKVTATSSQLSEPPRTGNQRNLVGRPSSGTENRRCSTDP